MAITAGSTPTAAQLDALGGRLVAGWDTTAPAAPFSSSVTETDLWSVTFTPETSGTYRFESYTPYDGVSGEEAKYRLYVGGTERKPGLARMRAGSFVDYLMLSAVVDLSSTSSVTVKVTGIRTSGTNTVQCRLAARQLYVYKVQSSGSGLISA